MPSLFWIRKLLHRPELLFFLQNGAVTELWSTKTMVQFSWFQAYKYLFYMQTTFSSWTLLVVNYGTNQYPFPKFFFIWKLFIFYHTCSTMVSIWSLHSFFNLHLIWSGLWRVNITEVQANSWCSISLATVVKCRCGLIQWHPGHKQVSFPPSCSPPCWNHT